MQSAPRSDVPVRDLIRQSLPWSAAAFAGLIALGIIESHLAHPTGTDAANILNVTAWSVWFLVACTLAWSAFPLVRLGGVRLAIVAIVIAVTSAALTLTHATIIADCARIFAAFAAGAAIARGVMRLYHLAVSLVVMSCVDAWSALSTSGVTRTVVEHHPRALEWATIHVPTPGIALADGARIGVADMLVTALIIATSGLFGVGRGRAAIAVTAGFVATYSLSMWLERPLPAIPAIAILWIAFNARSLAVSVRNGW